MRSKLQNKDFKFDLKNYIYFFNLAIFHPKLYIERTGSYKSSKTAFYFLVLNISLGLIVLIIEKIILNRNLSLAFPAISETLFWIPLGVAILTCFTFILHIGAKIFGGKGSFKESINAACYSSIPLTVFAVPYLFVVSLIWMAVLLILAFRKVHLYPSQSAVINITFPFIIIMLGMIMLGVLNPVKLYYKITNLTSLVQANY